MAKALMDDEQLAEYINAGSIAFEEKNFTLAEMKFTLAVRESERLGVNDITLASCMHNLAAVLSRNGNYVAAFSFFQRALKILDAAADPNGDEVLDELKLLEQTSTYLKDYHSAESYTKRIIAVLENNLGKGHPDLCEWFTRAGAHLVNLKRYSEADAVLNMSLRIAERSYGPNASEVGKILHNLGTLHRARKVYPLAIDFFKRSISLEEQQSSPERNFIAAALNSLGSLYVDQNNFIDAELCFSRGIALIQGNASMATTESILLSNLGVISLRKHDLPNAEQYFRRCMLMRESESNQFNADLMFTMRNLVNVLNMQNRVADAIEIQERSLDKLESLIEPPPDDQIPAALFSLSYLYDAADRCTEGDAMLERWVKMAQSSDVQGVCLGLEAMAGSPVPGSRKRIARRLLKLREFAFGKTHPEVLKSLVLMISVQDEQGDDIELENLLIRTVDVAKICHGEFSAEAAGLLDRLGQFYAESAQFEKAAENLEAALLIRRKIASVEHPDVRSGIYRLAFVQADLGLTQRTSALLKEANGSRTDTFSALSELAASREEEGIDSECLWLYEKALVVLQKAGRGESLEAAKIYDHLGQLHLRQRRPERAKVSFEKAIALIETIDGVDSLELVPVIENQIQLFSWTTEGVEINENNLRRILQINEKAYGHEHAEYAKSLRLVARFIGIRNDEASETYLHAALSVLEKLSEREESELPETLLELFSLKEKLGKYVEAEELLNRARKILSSLPAKNNETLALCEYYFAEFLLRLGRDEEAETAFVRALDVWRSTENVEIMQPTRKACLRKFADHLRSLNRIDDALPLERELEELGGL